eukprot:CAMPEP_0169462946 /NCGR_PEP_ID=MMETSP1042-20121227/19837_1 /TAXON_ID=464988 /ORGANISM="Hemiselmis andersenii, Strain CCMP1180" /LENGTH=273 /DNA_ID=CAMNT_0009575629 /DNA_START=179 /DNA_END=1004 /DNA_ORIENTATION=+
MGPLSRETRQEPTPQAHSGTTPPPPCTRRTAPPAPAQRGTAHRMPPRPLTPNAAPPSSMPIDSVAVDVAPCADDAPHAERKRPHKPEVEHVEELSPRGQCQYMNVPMKKHHAPMQGPISTSVAVFLSHDPPQSLDAEAPPNRPYSVHFPKLAQPNHKRPLDKALNAYLVTPGIDRREETNATHQVEHASPPITHDVHPHPLALLRIRHCLLRVKAQESRAPYRVPQRRVVEPSVPLGITEEHPRPKHERPPSDNEEDAVPSFHAGENSGLAAS